MFAFLTRDLPATGSVLYPGSIPPPLDQLTIFREAASCAPVAASPRHVWAVEATHPAWGIAEIACAREPMPLPGELIDHVLNLTEEEKARARRGAATVYVRLRASQKHVLRDRKRLLGWLRGLMRSDGAIAYDASSSLMWSEAMLDDELSHDADLDIESLYAIHAVQAADSPGVSWLHTHGLAELGAFDVDALEPADLFVQNCGDPVRALAFAALERAIDPSTDRFVLVMPEGAVRFVPADRFQKEAAPEHQRLRNADAGHDGRRAVLCEPRGGLLGRLRSRPQPSTLISRLREGNLAVPFSHEATNLMADRARNTLAVFSALREEFASLDLPAVVKLGYAVDHGEPGDREHLWFAVHAVSDDSIEATLINTPIAVSALAAGQRARHGLERLTDWMIMSPEGSMTPRNVSAARRLRDTRSTWQARLDAAKPL